MHALACYQIDESYHTCCCCTEDIGDDRDGNNYNRFDGFHNYGDNDQWSWYFFDGKKDNWQSENDWCEGGKYRRLPQLLTHLLCPGPQDGDDHDGDGGDGVDSDYGDDSGYVENSCLTFGILVM